MEQQKQVIAIKWGKAYSADYVNRLYAMVRRNTTGALRFVIFTDNREGIRDEIECQDLPSLGCEHPVNTPGKWRKVALWGADVGGLTGPTLFIDLDSAIVGSIDEYFSYGEPDDVILERNWARPTARLGQTSVFRFPIGKNPEVLERFKANPQKVAEEFRYEQHYITDCFQDTLKMWPAGWTRHFRMHCIPAVPLRYFIAPKLPSRARIVTFPGGPNPARVVQGGWYGKGPVSPLSHFLATFAGERSHVSRWQHLKRFVLPCPWLVEHWRE